MTYFTIIFATTVLAIAFGIQNGLETPKISIYEEFDRKMERRNRRILFWSNIQFWNWL
jgi:hypothetical protein